ncbi:MAG: hypothetical protein H6Q73_441 [Firmicutes bacterium]|nr:hypothetical protein [Bacillota bacterium]
MLPFPKTVKQRAIFVSGILVAALALAYYFGAFALIYDIPYRQPDAEVAGQDARIKITENTDLVQKIMYLKCGDEEEFRTKPADSLIGLNLSQVQKVYNGWNIEKFDSKEVLMTIKVDSYCREHANNMYLGIKDGHVAVFYGRPGSKAIVKEVTDILVNNLYEKDAEELNHGVVIGSREELLRTLEGLQAQ